MKQPPLTLQTPRTILRNLIIDDAEDFYALNLDQEVIKYTGDKPFENVHFLATLLPIVYICYRIQPLDSVNITAYTDPPVTVDTAPPVPLPPFCGFWVFPQDPKKTQHSHISQKLLPLFGINQTVKLYG